MRTQLLGRLLLYLIGVGVLLFCSLQVSAQGVFGTISGTILDSSRAVVPGATVTVTNVNTGTARTVITNEAGIYNATSLIPGVYKVEAEMPGFKKAIVSDISLDVNANSKVDIVLEVGEATEIVNVSAETPLLTTQQSHLSTSVTDKQLELLPLQGGLGRDIYSLIPLAAGVSQQKGMMGYDNENLRINGGRPRTDEYLLDGTTIEQPVWGGQAVSVSIDSIQEFRIETNALSAEYGKASGGVLAAVSKSGSNAFHGSIYEYNRDDALAARNYFEDPSLPKNQQRYNEFGGSLGGPIIKNKLFFFTDYQGVIASGTTPRANQSLPSAALRKGDFSALGTPITDPLTGAQFPGNQIPSSRFSPAAQKLMALLPASQTPSGTPGVDSYLLLAAGEQKVHRFNPRIDYQMSDADRVFGVFHYQWSKSMFGSIIPGPQGAQFGWGPARSVSAGWTHTFSSTTLNDFRFGYMHRVGDRTNYGQGELGAADFGIAIPKCDLPHTGDGTKCGVPEINVLGFTSFGGNGELYEPARSLQFTDTLSKVMGRHSLKLGAELRHYTIDNIQPENSGSFTFNGSHTGHAWADFLLGTILEGDVSMQTEYLSSRAWADAFFIQDDWKITPQLTLNLGLRYQLDYSFREIHNAFAYFNPFTIAWEQFGVNAPDTPHDVSYKQFGPRIGFAWNPAGGFVVRGGYGIMYPGYIGHGRAGDGEPSPALLAKTTFSDGTSLDHLPTVNLPSNDFSQPLSKELTGWAYWAPRKQTPPYVQLWNFTLEKQLNTNTAAQIAYVGSRGTHLPINYAYNLCQQSRANVAAYGWDAAEMDSPYCPGAAAAVGGAWNLYINPGWWGMSNSIYHSMQAKFDKRLSNGFSVLANFTWSKLIDDSSSDWGGFGELDVNGQDFYDRRSDRTVSQGDIPTRLTVVPVFELPLGPGHRWLDNGLAGKILGNWRMSAIYTVSSGYPLGMQDTCWGYCSPAHVINTRPMVVGDPLPAGFKQTTHAWFNTSAFDWGGTDDSDPAKSFGNAPRFFSSLRTPAWNNLDFSLQKDFKMAKFGEEGRIRVRLDAVNVLNHPQFGTPVTWSGANFGMIEGTSTPNRTIQLGAHFYF